MYSTRPGLILGFHGCDESLVSEVLTGKTALRKSTNKYDWLGHGVYMWDNSPARALEFAEFLKANPGKSIRPVKNPAVIGAVLNLGFCLDLLDYQNLSLIKEAHDMLKLFRIILGKDMPVNTPLGRNNDLLLRELDCAVIEHLHFFRDLGAIQPFDSIRGVFSEGEELYENAGFKEKDHIQICIRNPNCIKGYFRPMMENSKYQKV
ncbi:hypothetical protein SAMN05421820_106377 [Pedobacter steynii]|uniref:Uncharacterized protein n=1 Tax=Pedobacter steynii TaxID=430522 RepID=A0A1G9Z6U1_9SPHI|nr:hypothetical protein [Pedobacter steynii]NQX39974.1 hypothetical protein [Pedobacter steynii]SDN17288.1 hypothetical protein SAMN05421820_106377 [Pedobacter steynii]